MCVVAHLSERKRQDHLTPLSNPFSLCSRCLLLHICLGERDRITSLEPLQSLQQVSVVAHLSERKRQDHLTPLSNPFSLCSRCLLLHICLRERDRITSLLSRSSSVSAAGVCCCTSVWGKETGSPHSSLEALQSLQQVCVVAHLSERKRQDHLTPLSNPFSLCSRCVLLHICLGERDRITSLEPLQSLQQVSVVAHLSERKRQDHLTPLSNPFSLCSRCLLLHICLRERDRITSLLSRSSSVSAAGVCCCTSVWGKGTGSPHSSLNSSPWLSQRL